MKKILSVVIAVVMLFAGVAMAVAGTAVFFLTVDKDDI